MPKSRGRKKRNHSNLRAAKHTSVGGISFSRFEIGGEDQEEFRQAVFSAAKQNVAELPKLLNQLNEIFRERTPEGILTTFAFYGSQGSVNAKGELKSLSKDILQHHVELLQAFALTVPLEEWGEGPPTSDVMHVVFDIVPKISDTFIQTRLLERNEEDDAQKQAVMSLQEKIRLHTQAVRNWGYYREVVSICRELYSPLDAKLSAKLGFTATDFIDVSDALVREIERRASEHMNRLAKIFKAKEIKEMVASYYENMPDIEGSPDDFLKLIPEGTQRDGVIGALLSHADLRHLDTMTFTAAQLSELTGKSEAVTQKVLESISRKPGDLVGAETMHLFLANPVWTKPGINYGTSFIITLPQAIFSHINEILREIIASAGLEKVLTDRRASFLEDKTADVLQSVFPTAHILKNAKWTVGAQQFETDVLALVDRTLFLAEAKSHRLTPQGLRGAPDRLKRHLSDMVVEPSVQSERLANLLLAAQAGDRTGIAVAAELKIDPDRIDNIIRISITLDDLSVLSSAEDELKAVGWVPEGHELAPSLHIADLICIATILDNEALVLHYFAERFHFQKAFELLGDELDFLGMYLSTGFNLGKRRDDFRNLMISGLSGPIDRYYEAHYAGFSLPKPRAKLHKVYRDIIARLIERKPDGWSTMAIHLLNSASPDEQIKVNQGLNRLKHAVRKNAQNPGKECYMEIIPPLDRKATIGFYVFPEREKANRRNNMEQCAAVALERDEATTCVIFGRNIDSWDTPYEAVLIAKKS